jgi:hypothetical protein
VEPEDVRAGGVRGVPAGEARLRPRQRAQPRQGRGRAGDGSEHARPTGERAARPADGARLLQAGRLLPQYRAVQRRGRLPQDAGRRDVPQLPRHEGRARHHPRQGECFAAGAGGGGRRECRPERGA